MAKVHIGNLVEIRHWIVPDEDVNDNGYWVTQDRFQNVNTTNDHQLWRTGLLVFVVHLPRRNP